MAPHVSLGHVTPLTMAAVIPLPLTSAQPDDDIVDLADATFGPHGPTAFCPTPRSTHCHHHALLLAIRPPLARPTPPPSDGTTCFSFHLASPCLLFAADLRDVANCRFRR